MNRLVLFLVVLLSLGCLGQTAENTLPPGVAFPAQMINHVDARKAKVGDEVKLEASANLRGPGGVVAIPQGAKLTGTVTAVTDRKSSDGESRLSFLITKAEWHGGSMALHAVPTAVTALRMRTVSGSGGGSGGAGGDSAGLTGGDMGGGRGGRSGGGGGRGSDTSAMISQAIAQELKGTSAQAVPDPKIAMVLVNSKRDVSLPSGTVVTLRQVKPAE